MIIDRVILAGLDAYLLDDGSVNLATSISHAGQSLSIKEGEGAGLDVSGINLFLKTKNLLKLYPRLNLDGKPLLSVSVRKEMFPEFFADPYSNRVHTIAGFEDFQRGSYNNMRPMEVEGKATLVSLDVGECTWVSPAYRLHRPLFISSVTWDLVTSRLTSSDGFSYTLKLYCWFYGQNPETENPTEILVSPATGSGETSPQEVRSREGLNLSKVIAYRVGFSASVNYDTYLTEYQFGSEEKQSIGRPLLRAVHLLEPIESIYNIYSLHELEALCSEFSMLEVEPPLQSLSAYLDLSALLVESEQITLRVNPDVFEYCEARLDAEIRIRPPLIDKVLGN